MIRFGKLTRMINAFLAEVSGLGGVTQNRYISPKGLYSNPTDEDVLVVPLSEGTSQDIVITLQKPVDIEVGDVVLTDDNNLMHLKFDGNQILIVTDNLVIKSPKIELDGDVTISGATTIAGGLAVTGDLKNNGVPVGSTHKHEQVADGGAGGVPTTPPLPS